MVGEDQQSPPAIRSRFDQPLLGDVQHGFFELRHAQAGMHLKMRLPAAFGVQDRGDSAIGRLPDEGDVFDGVARLAILHDMPPPVVKPRHMPAQLPPAVEQHHLPKEVTDPPGVVFIAVATQGRFHHAIMIQQELPDGIGQLGS